MSVNIYRTTRRHTLSQKALLFIGTAVRTLNRNSKKASQKKNTKLNAPDIMHELLDLKYIWLWTIYWIQTAIDCIHELEET
jgi:hypothetical protein